MKYDWIEIFVNRADKPLIIQAFKEMGQYIVKLQRKNEKLRKKLKKNASEKV